MQQVETCTHLNTPETGSYLFTGVVQTDWQTDSWNTWCLGKCSFGTCTPFYFLKILTILHDFEGSHRPFEGCQLFSENVFKMFNGQRNLFGWLRKWIGRMFSDWRGWLIDWMVELWRASWLVDGKVGWFGWIYKRPNSQIAQCACPISHNTPFRTEMCTFLFWMVHCKI